MRTYTILLKDGTIGNIKTSKEIVEGQKITVDLCDENGNEIQVTGKIEEILEIDYL